MRAFVSVLLLVTFGNLAQAQTIYFPADASSWEQVDPASVGWNADWLSADPVAMQGAMDRKLYLIPSLNLVITRLGASGRANDQSFNEAFWSAIMKAKL